MTPWDIHIPHYQCVGSYAIYVTPSAVNRRLTDCLYMVTTFKTILIKVMPNRSEMDIGSHLSFISNSCLLNMEAGVLRLTSGLGSFTDSGTQWRINFFYEGANYFCRWMINFRVGIPALINFMACWHVIDVKCPSLQALKDLCMSHICYTLNYFPPLFSEFQMVQCFFYSSYTYQWNKL